MYNSRIMILGLNFLILIVATIQTQRFKRQIVFQKSSKYFLRVNGKENMINHTDIFAHGWGVRVNWDLPDTLSKRFKLFKRDIHDNIETLRDGRAKEGFSCIVKYLCEYRDFMTSNEAECGIFCGIGRIILNGGGGFEGDFFRSFLDKCDYHIDTCPYSFKHSSIYNYG